MSHIETALKDENTQPSLWQSVWIYKTDLILGAAFLLITGLYGLLMLKEQIPAIGLAVLCILCLLYWILGGRLTFATPMDLPALGLLGMLPLSLLISVDWDTSLPFVYGLVLSIAFFYVIVNAIRDYSRLRLAIWALIILAVGTALLGLLGTDWVDVKFPILSLVYDRLPRLSNFIPGVESVSGINVNTMGGALALFVPLLAGLLWDGGAYFRTYQQEGRYPRLAKIFYKLIILIGLMLVSLSLILTQSRGAYLGSLVGLVVLAIWKDRRFFWVVPVIAIGLFLASHYFADDNITRFLSLIDTSGQETLTNRLTLWRNAGYFIQDFPLTGAGIGTFGKLFQELYTYNIFVYQAPLYFHPHNTFISIAVDLGLPALVLYAALLSSFVVMIWRFFKIGRSITRMLLMGLVCGMLAHQVFGITDAYVLGKKFGIFMWIFFGVVTAIYVHRKNFYWKHSLTKLPNPGAYLDKPGWGQIIPRLRDLLVGLLYWLAFSLAAVAFINVNPYISLVIALVSGGFLGIILVKRYQQTGRALRTESFVN